MCLIGDAAHAPLPYIGQGAAISIEDAVVLAKCLRDIPNIEESFAKFESLRKGRAEKIVKESQKSAKIYLKTGLWGNYFVFSRFLFYRNLILNGDRIGYFHTKLIGIKKSHES